VSLEQIYYSWKYSRYFDFLEVKEVFMRKKGWSEKQIEEQILRRYQENELTNFTEFDSRSIMMYVHSSSSYSCVLINNDFRAQVLHAQRNEQ
jgi:hypothetical protein